jgi:acyl carrier protein
VCGKVAALEPSYPGGDSTCPSCGHLLWWFRDRFGQDITLSSSLADDVGLASLDVVEVLMEVEEEFNVTISPHEADQVKTVADAIQLIEKYRHGEIS